MQKKLLLLAFNTCEHLWTPNSGHKNSEEAGGALQQWQQRQWLTSTGAGF